MVRYSLTYRHPLHHQICSRATETGGGLGLCIFLFSSPTWSPQRKRPVWWPCGQIYLSCSGKHKLRPFQEWTSSTCARCRESHEAHMHAHLSVDNSCHHHIRGIGTSMTRLRQVNYLSFWFSFCPLLLPPTTSHSSSIVPLVMHKLVPFSHSLSCSCCRHPLPLSTFHRKTQDSSLERAQTARFCTNLAHVVWACAKTSLIYHSHLMFVWRDLFLFKWN